MRKHEVCDGVLMTLVVDRRGNKKRVEGSKFQIGFERCTITQLDLVPALAHMRCRPTGNFSRLPFGRSIDNQNVHDIPPTTEETFIGTVHTGHPGVRCFNDIINYIASVVEQAL